MSSSTRISPTAYATGQMWVRLGLSDPRLATRKGRLYDRAFQALTRPVERFGGVSFDDLMWARHAGIDARLGDAIRKGKVTQVIELAAGLSGRGLRLCRQHPQLQRYVESDLPEMVRAKKRLLTQAGLHDARLHCQVIDVLAPDGPNGLTAATRSLDHEQGLAIITEGLMNYLNPSQAELVWRSIARTLSGFSHGLYLSDFYLRNENQGFLVRAFGGVLQSFVRGRLHIHFATQDEARDSLLQQGFARVRSLTAGEIPDTANIYHRGSARQVRVLEAWTETSSS